VTAPAPPDLQRARQWSSALASALDEVSARLDPVVRRVAEGWPDAHGGEWAERLAALRRALAHDADAAAELGRAIDRVAEHVSARSGDPPAGSHPALHGGTSGPRLGGTGARRVDDERGVTVPRLTDAADSAG
jgi:hypothetical protein